MPELNDEEIVAFFRSLSADARREYEALAEKDRRYGEDVAAERRALSPENKEKGP